MMTVEEIKLLVDSQLAKDVLTDYIREHPEENIFYDKEEINIKDYLTK